MTLSSNRGRQVLEAYQEEHGEPEAYPPEVAVELIRDLLAHISEEADEDAARWVADEVL